MKPNNLFILTIFIALISLSSQTQYLTNNDFSTNTCSSTTCTISNINDWTAFTYADTAQTTKTFGLLSNNFVVGSVSTRWWLNTNSQLCLSKYIIEPPQGNYQLSLNAYLTSTAVSVLTQPLYVKIQTLSKNQIHSQTIYLAAKSTVQNKIISFTLSHSYSKIRLLICDTTSSATAVKFTDVHLTSLDPALACNPITQSKIIVGTDQIITCTPNQLTQNSINCLHYQLKSASITQYQCSQCDQSIGSTTKHLVNIGSYKGCAQYLISTVQIYKSTTTLDSSNKPFVIPIQCNIISNTQMTCYPSLIIDCQFYNLDGSCKTCIFGLNFDLTNNICPNSPNIPNCEKVHQLNGLYYCSYCKIGFMITQKSKCMKNTAYCMTYKNQICIKCILGYFLYQNQCIKQSLQCLLTDQNGKCLQCQIQFYVSEGICIKKQIIVSCKQDEYINLQKKCIKGKVDNCLAYQSPYGQCSICKDGYKLGQQKQCLFICPPDSFSQKYILQNGICILTDLYCSYTNQNGFCSVCENGYYPQFGRCFEYNLIQSQNSNQANKKAKSYSLTNTQSRIVQLSIEQGSLLKDQYGFIYFLKPNGSRSYITGNWKGLDVQEDEKGDLYQSIDKGKIKYLSGSAAGLIRYLDQNGNWYTLVNTTGQNLLKLEYENNDDSNVNNLRK